MTAPAASEESARSVLELPVNVAGERLFVGRSQTSWSRPEQIAARIGEQIINEELKPGERLRENVLAQTFHVSRGPIRDALSVLQGVGLVAINRRRGTVVTSLTELDLREILELREALIALALRRFAQAARPGDVALVRPHLEAASSLMDDDTKRLVWREALDRLLLAIAYRAGNARLARQLMLLSLQAVRYIRRGPATLASRRELFAFFRDYLLAVERGDGVERFIVQLHRIVRARIDSISEAL